VTFVAWCWLEDPNYGFDIVSYTGTGVAHTEAHSLGVVPEMIIVKNRDDGSRDWKVYHKELNGGTTPEQYYLELNNTDAESNTPATVHWNDTAPTSSVFSVGTAAAVNGSGDELIAYLFASVEGFSKVFSYTGNGAADGPFVHCGFRPRFVLIKNASAVASWLLYDTERSTYNTVDDVLFPDKSDTETVTSAIDALSNGFKLRNDGASANGSGNTLVGIAFAETPFKYANAR
jgi:hypothetical protein